MSANIYMFDTVISADQHGLFCLNDLHRACVGEERHSPANWLKTGSAIETIKRLEAIGYKPVNVMKGVVHACEELVYAYAIFVALGFSL